MRVCECCPFEQNWFHASNGQPGKHASELALSLHFENGRGA
jgi:hypothetical protein